MKTIVVEVKNEMLIEYGIEVAIEKVQSAIMELLKDKKFYNYIAQRLSGAIMGIAFEETANIGSDVMSSTEIGDYLSSFKTEIVDESIVLYNDSVIDTSTKNMSDEKRAGYPLKLSLAKLIEYGFGYTGYLTTQEVIDNWEYDINEHGYKGWYYEDSQGQIHWTNGMEGRLVFLKLCWWLEKNFADIVCRYLKNNL